MDKEEVKELLAHCYLCGDDLRKGDSDSTFANVDGANVPVCGGCDDLVEEYKWDSARSLEDCV